MLCPLADLPVVGLRLKKTFNQNVIFSVSTLWALLHEVVCFPMSCFIHFNRVSGLEIAYQFQS